MTELNFEQMEQLTGGECNRTTTTDIVGTLFAGVIYWIAVAIAC